MSDEVIEALKQVPLFRGMSDKALARVAEISKEVSHRAGKTILEEDHSAVGFHLILSGEADATGQGGRQHDGPGRLLRRDVADRRETTLGLVVVRRNSARSRSRHGTSTGSSMRTPTWWALLVSLSARIRHMRDQG